jgi:hypothetical protein
MKKYLAITGLIMLSNSAMALPPNCNNEIIGYSKQIIASAKTIVRDEEDRMDQILERAAEQGQMAKYVQPAFVSKAQAVLKTTRLYLGNYAATKQADWDLAQKICDANFDVREVVGLPKK